MRTQPHSHFYQLTQPFVRCNICISVVATEFYIILEFTNCVDSSRCWEIIESAVFCGPRSNRAVTTLMRSQAAAGYQISHSTIAVDQSNAPSTGLIWPIANAYHSLLQLVNSNILSHSTTPLKSFLKPHFFSPSNFQQPSHFSSWLDVSNLRRTLQSNESILTVPSGGKGGKGLGKGGAKRHRKILRDNIQGITKPAIRRLARRGGVKRISAMIYEETRGVLKTFLEVGFPCARSWYVIWLHTGCHPWCCYIYWARQAKDSHVSRRCLCSEASRPHSVRFWWIDFRLVLLLSWDGADGMGFEMPTGHGYDSCNTLGTWGWRFGTSWEYVTASAWMKLIPKSCMSILHTLSLPYIANHTCCGLASLSAQVCVTYE